jgi:outer membrane protein assembly factor BamB
MRHPRSRRAAPSVLALLWITAGCNADEESSVADAESTAESSADVGLAASPDTSSAPGADVGCTGGEPPAIRAYHLETGEVSWQRCHSGTARRSVAGATDEVVFLAEQLADPASGATGSPHLLALDAASGDALWQLDIGLVPAGPFVASGVAVVGLQDEQGLAAVGVDPTTGQIVWRTPLESSAPIATTDTVVILQTASQGPVADFRALDRETGSELWSTQVAVTSGDPGPLFGASVDGDTVVVLPGPVALDATTGEELWRLADDVGAGAIGPASDGVMAWGGQDDPTSGIDMATGELLWTMPGSPPYDDVWAVGDGAVFVVDQTSTEMIAYELADGSVRWRRAWDPVRYSWPYDVAGDTLVAMWTNVDAISTEDGSTRWATDEASDDFLRMTGTSANDATLFVAFSTIASGGD